MTEAVKLDLIAEIISDGQKGEEFGGGYYLALIDAINTIVYYQEGDGGTPKYNV